MVAIIPDSLSFTRTPGRCVRALRLLERRRERRVVDARDGHPDVDGRFPSKDVHVNRAVPCVVIDGIVSTGVWTVWFSGSSSGTSWSVPASRASCISRPMRPRMQKSRRDTMTP